MFNAIKFVFVRVICLHGGKGHGCGGEVLGYQGNKVLRYVIVLNWLV